MRDLGNIHERCGRPGAGGDSAALARRGAIGALTVVVLVVLAIGVPIVAISASVDVAAKRSTVCRLSYQLEGWSVFYKVSKGDGSITCDNGQKSKVSIEMHGGGLSFGTSETRDGKGRFSPVFELAALYGDYASAEAHAGSGVAVRAQVVAKDDVSLALLGKGTGINLGFAFSHFRIKPR